KFCDSTNFDISNWPIAFQLPAGTTRVDQLVICGAPKCAPGAAIHSHFLEVTIDDPQPPSISLSGALVSGHWVSGTTGSLAQLAVTATDNAGVQSIHTALGAQSPGQSYPCDWSRSQPCATHATMTSGPSVAELPDGRHPLWAGAVDAAGNSDLVGREVYVDNTPPDP